MLKAEQMYRMCLKKRKYKSEEVAKQIAKQCDEKYGVTHRVYYCPLCGHYHLTTKDLKGKQ